MVSHECTLQDMNRDVLFYETMKDGVFKNCDQTLKMFIKSDI